MFKKTISLFLSLSLIITQPIFAQGLSQLNLAQYLGQMHPSAIDSFRPTQLRYFFYDNLNNSYRILLDKGDLKDIKDNQLKEEAKELMDYFLIGLALPNDTFWVNLRPDSPDNIIDPELEKTDLGRILLEADLQLKKDTAGLTSPQTPEGKAYWDKLYKKAGELFATENITIPTLTRPWIVPGEIIVRESQNSAYIYKATLKVMLEEDYLSRDRSRTAPTMRTAPTPDQYNFTEPRLKELNEYSTQIIRETIIPKITREVNSSKKYAKLRQVYYSLVLSRWFKMRFSGKSAQYADLIDKHDLTNLTTQEPYNKRTYFKEYQESFAQGEYNLKEPVYTPYGQSVRSYMSGGFTAEYMNFSGPGIKTETASNPVEQQLLLPLRENTVILDNNFKIVDLKQPLAIAASPLGIKLIDNEDKYSNLRYVEYETLSDLSRAKLWNSFQSVASDANVEDNPEYSWGFAVELNKEEGIGRVLGAVKYKKDTETEPVTYVFGNSSEDIKNITAALKAKTKQKDEVVASPIEFYNEQEAEKWVKGNFKTGSISKYEYLLISNEDFVEMGELAKSIIQTIPKEIDIFQTSGKMAYGIPQTNVPLFHQKNYTIQPEVKGKPRARSISSEDWREVIIYFLAFIVIDDLDSLTTVSETKKSSLEKDAAIIFGEDGDVAFRLTLAQWWGKKYLPGYKSKELTKKQRAFFQKYFSVAASLLTIPEMQALGLTSAQDFMVKNIMPALHNIDVRATLDTTLVRGPDSTEGRARSLLETCKKYMLEFPEKYIQTTKIKINKKEIEEVTGTLALYFDPWFTARPENIAAAAGYLSRVMRDKFEEDIIAEGFKRLQQIINSIVENLVNKSDENKALSVIPLDKLIMELAVLKRETESHSAEERFSKLIELMSRVNEKDTEFKCEILDEIFFILTYRVAINNIASYALNNLQNVHGDMFNDYEPKYPTISKVLDAIKEGLKEDRLEILRQLESIGWNENKKISLRKDLETINRFIDTVTSAQKNKIENQRKPSVVSPLTNEWYVVNDADRGKMSGSKVILDMFSDDGKELIKRYPDSKELYEETEKKLKIYWKTEETYDIQKAAEAALEFYAAIAGIKPGGSKVEPEIENKIKILQDTGIIINGVVEKIKFLIEEDIVELGKKVNTGVVPKDLNKFSRELSLKNSKATVNYILFLLSDRFKPYRGNIPESFIEDSTVKYFLIKTELEIFDFSPTASSAMAEEYIIDDQDKEKITNIKYFFKMLPFEAPEFIERIRNPELRRELQNLYQEINKRIITAKEANDIIGVSEALREFYAATAGFQSQESNVMPKVSEKLAELAELDELKSIINTVVEKVKTLIELDITGLEEVISNKEDIDLTELESIIKELNLNNLKPAALEMEALFNKYRPNDYNQYVRKWASIRTELKIFDLSTVSSALTVAEIRRQIENILDKLPDSRMAKYYKELISSIKEMEKLLKSVKEIILEIGEYAQEKRDESIEDARQGNSKASNESFRESQASLLAKEQLESLIMPEGKKETGDEGSAASSLVLSEYQFLTNMNNILSMKDISPENAFIELIDGLSRLKKGTVLTDAIGTVCLILSAASKNKNEIKWLFSVMEKRIYGVYIQRVTLRHETISVEETLKIIGIELELNSRRLDREKEGDFIKECRRINNRFIAAVKEARGANANQDEPSTASALQEFKIGGINSNESIDVLTELTGLPIEEIERRARPGAYSESGFISESESFKEVLKKDNAFVLGEKLTHQKLAEPLLKAMERLILTYNGRQFSVRESKYLSHQASIFNDALKDKPNYVVTNMTTKKTISFSGFLPLYILNYGFYEGAVRHRLEPIAIIDFFGITASSGLTSEPQPSLPLGGIDFTDKAMRIGLERMGSFADLKLVLPEIANVAALDLDNEFKQIQNMALSGIRPADTRILEFAAACYYREEFSLRLGEITSCLQQAHFLDERLGRESSPALRLATMLPEVL